MALRTLSLCSGVAGLDLGVAIAAPGARVVCHVEREAYAAAVLVARMAESALEPAPIWDDLATFDGKPWRGVVDLITAGFPCQPWSCAGKQQGTADERWIWDDIARIIREVGPSLVFLENVPGLISGGGLGLVLGSLAALGFDAEWGVLKASEVGAPHERERVFILAVSQSFKRDGGERTRRGRTGSANVGSDVVHAERSERRQGEPGGDVRYGQDAEREEEAGRPRRSDPQVSDPKGISQHLRAERGVALSVTPCGCGELGNAHDGGAGQQRLGAAAEVARPGSASAFPPVRDDPRWIGILALSPHLAPAVEPGVRVLADGVAVVVDASRADQIRCVGNGVVALCAAAAFRLLARRAGISPGSLRPEEA